MKYIDNLILLFGLFFLMSCANSLQVERDKSIKQPIPDHLQSRINERRNNLKENGNKTKIIENVLLDFSNTSRYYKKDSVFSISFYDIYPETMAVSILPYYNSLVLYPNDSIGQKSKSFPTHFIEMDNKLFYWYDSNEILKQSTIDKLIEYNIVYFANSNDFEIPENTYIDEKTKGTAYYICKNNFKNYKKVLRSIGVGYYEPPELNCHP